MNVHADGRCPRSSCQKRVVHHSPCRTSPLCQPWVCTRLLKFTDPRAEVEDYQAGATSRDIAKRYGISKTAVLRLLRTGGAAVRPRGPAPGSPLQAALAPER